MTLEEVAAYFARSSVDGLSTAQGPEHSRI
jgi:hypothetical protein